MILKYANLFIRFMTCAKKQELKLNCTHTHKIGMSFLDGKRRASNIHLCRDANDHLTTGTPIGEYFDCCYWLVKYFGQLRTSELLCFFFDHFWLLITSLLGVKRSSSCCPSNVSLDRKSIPHLANESKLTYFVCAMKSKRSSRTHNKHKLELKCRKHFHPNLFWFPFIRNGRPFEFTETWKLLSTFAIFGANTWNFYSYLALAF